MYTFFSLIRCDNCLNILPRCLTELHHVPWPKELEKSVFRHANRLCLIVITATNIT